MKAQGMINQLGSTWAKRESEKSTLLRRAVRWGLVVLLPVLIVGSLTTTSAFAQTAEISGTVTDSSGARVPNANITVLNRDTGISRSADSNTNGFYSVPLLQPGNYMITAKSTGFATQVRTGITLEVGAQQVLNFTLQVGQMTQTVEVTAEAPTVQLASSSISAVVNSTTVRELPLNGRSWTDLATLQTGVVAIQTQLASDVQGRGNRGFGAQISVAGGRPQQNNYRLDGVSINDYSNGGPGSVMGGNLGVDAIQEFSVLTSNYSAEYGRTSGGVVNAITRSGTNQFHGSVYEFLRNSALDARNFFDKKIPPFRRNQFGAEGGGPIRKDKLFIFGDYEGIRQSLGITKVDTVPSAAARQGIVGFSDPSKFPTGCVATSVPNQCQLTVDASTQKYLPFWPLPNDGIKAGTNGNIGIFTFAGQEVISENFFTTRVDNKISEKDSLGATYLGDITPFSTPDGLDAKLINSRTNRQIGTLEETHIFDPSLVNSARFGYSRDAAINSFGLSAINPLAQDPSLAAIPGQFAANVSVPGLTLFTGGLKGNSHFLFYWNSFQGYDDLFWTHRTHSIKIGGAVERMDLNMYGVNDPAGVFSFGTLSTFLTNHPKRFTAGFADSLTGRGFRQTLVGLYIHDDWRARPNLTINLGLRWEMTTVPTEVQGKLANLLSLTDSVAHLGSPLFSNPTLRNFEPRVGFAWDPFHNAKTAVRGGFGAFDVLPLLYEFWGTQYRAFPFFRAGAATKLPAGSFFTGATPLLGSASNEDTYIEQHPHRNYVMQWNLNIQRELVPNLTALVGYVGSRGVHQPTRFDDMDIVLPTKTPQGYLFPSPVGSGTKLNPNFGSIRGTIYDGNSLYDALEVGVQKRMSHGFQFQGSLTWGKSIDNTSSSGASDQFSASIPSLLWFDPKASRGLSEFNVGRTLVISAIWQVPSLKTFSGPAAWIMNGWELGAIYKASDGVPFTPTFGTDGDPQGLNSSDPWDFPNRLTGPGCETLTNPGNPNHYIKTQCFAVPTAPSAAFYTANCDPSLGTFPQCFNLRGNAGRDILIGPGTSNLDFSIFKNNYIKRISESFNVQFRAEFFNILNHANFAVPVLPDNTDIFDSTGAPTGVAGLLTSTTTTAREIQFALKIAW